MTQQQLADVMGISPQYLRRVESGGANLSIKSLAKFAHALAVEVAELFVVPSGREPRRPGRPPGR